MCNSYFYIIAVYGSKTKSTTYLTEEIPVKEAVYSEPFNQTFSYAPFDDTILVCGEDIPNQELTIDYDGGTTIAVFQDVGNGSNKGKPLAQEESFNCTDKKQVRI